MKTTKNTNKQFWTLNVLGWFIYLFFGGIFFSMMQGGLNLNTLYIQSFSFFILIFGCGLLRQLIKSNNLIHSISSIKTIVTLFGATLILAFVTQFLVSLLMMYGLHIMNWQAYSFSILAITTVQAWISIIGWTLVYFVIKHRQKNRFQEIEKWRLQSALKEAELQSLKSQLNPHFIFNCLNNIRAIAIDDGEKTREMITHLSEILKFMFQFNQQKLVTLEQEINCVRNYLVLESIQLDDRLTSKISVEEGLENWQIPPLSIQLLVENAIKHGIMQLENGGEINIHVYSKNEKLLIDVLNDGVLLNLKEKGIGLDNLKKRLSLLISEYSTLTLQQLNEYQVKAQIILIKP